MFRARRARRRWWDRLCLLVGVIMCTLCTLPTTECGSAPNPQPAAPPSLSRSPSPTLTPTARPTQTTSAIFTTTTGRISYTVSSVSDYMSWLIQPSVPTATIQIVLEAMNVQAAQLRIFDTAQRNSGKSILNCVTCGATLPPPFTSSSGSVTVTVQGVSGVTFVPSSFTLFFIAIPTALSALPPSISVNLFMGHTSIAPYAVNGSVPAPATQQWLLRQASGTTITFAFDSLKLAEDCTDRVSVYDRVDRSSGNLLFTGCRSSDLPLRWFYSFTGEASVIFTTSPSASSSSSSSFNLKYYSDTSWYSCGALSWPETYRGPSLLLMDGSGPALMRRGDACSWKLTPSLPSTAQAQTESESKAETHTASLVFSEVSLKFGSSVVVYDSSDDKGTVLWSGIGATTTVPPIIRSSGSALFVSYLTDTSDPVRFTGFLGDYSLDYAGSLGSGRGYSTLRMSSEIDLRPPGSALKATPCLNYTWIIEPSVARAPIVFSLSQLDLYENTMLSLFDGEENQGVLLAVFRSGDTPPSKWISTSSARATLSLRCSEQTHAVSQNILNTTSNNRSCSATGLFHLSYFADGPNYHCGFTRNPAVLRSQSWVLTDGSLSTEPLYASQYCEWDIDVEENVNNNKNNNGTVVGVYLFFSRFSVLGGSLIIYCGPVAENDVYMTISNTIAVPAPVYVPCTQAGVAYTTASVASGYGFSLAYYAVWDASSFPGNDVVHLRSASLLSLRLFPATREPVDVSVGVSGNGSEDVSSGVNKTWIVSPAASTGKLYVAIVSLSLSSPCAQMSLNLFDGTVENNAALLARLCETTTAPLPYKWIVTSATQMRVSFHTSPFLTLTNNSAINGNTDSTKANFELAYFSDGANYRCGIARDGAPATLSAPSMVFTDGSASTEHMQADQRCEWIIDPLLPVGERETGRQAMLVLEFLRCDLRGAVLSVHKRVVREKRTGTGTVAESETEIMIWNCTKCSYRPQPLIALSANNNTRNGSTEKTVFVVRFQSFSDSERGLGFTAIYWTSTHNMLTNSTNTTAQQQTERATLLDAPEGFRFDASLRAEAPAYRLSLPLSAVRPSTLHFFPRFSLAQREAHTQSESVFDGRPSAASMFESPQRSLSVCGILSHSDKADTNTDDTVALIERDVLFHTPQQSASAYLRSSIDSKSVWTVSGEEDIQAETEREAYIATDEDVLQPLDVCRYSLDSGSRRQAVRVHIQSLRLTHNGRLRVYGGVSHNDTLFFDSNDVSSSPSGASVANLTLPCGKSLILAENNATNASTGAIDYSWSFSFHRIDNDNGTLCDLYIASLQPKPKRKDPYIPFYISAGAIGGFIVIVALVVHAMQLKHRRGYVFYPKNEFTTVTYASVTPGYPRHFGSWTTFANRFAVRKGQCCVCKMEGVNVFSLQCKHTLCAEDLQSYLGSALGDISMFPVKCPMHFENCTATVEPALARRVLSEPQYQRFLEFSDRAAFGDGMRCIFCHNFVNFPKEMGHSSRVECPYCIQRFCIRCRKPWHVNARCPLEALDESVEVWKADSGAQRCPACKKLIEKADSETCNHMVHKLTDAIPCVCDRTDFCYLCGEQVLADYPHDEVRHPGVNHFPEGVFQRCRTIIAREKEAERERLRKQKRMKSKQTPSKKAVVMPSEGIAWQNPPNDSDTETVSSPPRTRNPQLPPLSPPPSSPARVSAYEVESVISANDDFDEEWNLALAQVHTGSLAISSTPTSSRNTSARLPAPVSAHVIPVRAVSASAPTSVPASASMPASLIHSPLRASRVSPSVSSTPSQSPTPSRTSSSRATKSFVRHHRTPSST